VRSSADTPDYISVLRYSRRLPHWHPDATSLFLTWCLAGSLPRNRFPPPHHAASGKAFAYIDRFLDQASFGPSWLRQDAIAQLVVSALHFSSETLHQYNLHAYVVMPNHVHMLVTPHAPTPDFMRTVKTFTAREANNLLDRTGQPFWQHESYDHWVRNDEQFQRIDRYIHENPVRAGLVSNSEDYRWSSAQAGGDAGMAG